MRAEALDGVFAGRGLAEAAPRLFLHLALVHYEVVHGGELEGLHVLLQSMLRQQMLVEVVAVADTRLA